MSDIEAAVYDSLLDAYADRMLASIGRDCRVYWGHAGCALPRGHPEPHACERGRHPEPGFMFGEDTTPDERSEMD